MDEKRTDSSAIFKQMSWWKRLALSLPYAFTGFFIFQYTFGFETIADRIFVIAATIGVTVTVAWWWWVMYTINHFSSVLQSTVSKLKEVKEDLQNIKKDL